MAIIEKICTPMQDVGQEESAVLSLLEKFEINVENKTMEDIMAENRKFI